MQAFWISLVMIFLAELGDKTQLVALCMATRFKAGVVLAGVFTATLFVHMVSVGLGGLAGELLPTTWITFTAGLAFIVFGMWTLRGDSLEDETCEQDKVRSPFWMVTITFFLAELGDKTMLSTVALAAKYPIFFVWLGSTLGMVLSDGLAILVGQVMGARLPERAVKIGAACIFFVFGVYSMFAVRQAMPVFAWPAGCVVLGVLAFIFFRRSSPAGIPAETAPVAEPVE